MAPHGQGVVGERPNRQADLPIWPARAGWLALLTNDGRASLPASEMTERHTRATVGYELSRAVRVQACIHEPQGRLGSFRTNLKTTRSLTGAQFPARAPES